jgi:hypothetical protein
LLLSYESSDRPVAEEGIQQDAGAMAEKYTGQLKFLVADYREAISNDELDTEKIKNIKNSILDLMVPAQYRDLHVQIVLALVKMEEFVKNKDQAYKIESSNLINEALANNSWLETK